MSNREQDPQDELVYDWGETPPLGTAGAREVGEEENRVAIGATVGSTHYSGQTVGVNQGATVSINATDTAHLEAHEEAMLGVLDKQLHSIARMRDAMQANQREIERLKTSTRATLARLRAA